ncbi:ribosomal protein L34 [Chloropicon primus]|uniref:Ribosomal protein L34 n=1 Tax=Chloropicon primus TaxID=1764295 RepID=A0A5B8MMA4_9CHLO|nr:ribosomal protein L34 [Chloropicon primus]UPR00989.1 ribosomal protein L34 [Chloropicon primus]|mmetsp:Transcript_6020/g.18038  ORF Transcript_6020/g.18038 Transcript_6020/m.18038 type:complete len:117 (+) Transcript_6020:125-475(+)|eukprot:QDZ21768.1 ribosomal protein L34 [Chloropicon primus]
MVQRLTYRRRHSYATKSNRVKKLKTPGGKLVFHYVAKKSNPAVDPMSKQILNGVPVLRPAKGSKSQTNKKDRTVHRPYGGVLSGANVRTRIVRAFLIEEQKIVKKVLKMQSKKSKK